MESVKQKVSKAADKLGKKVEESESNWTQLLSQLVDKLTGKDLAITYEFDSLQIDMPKATGPLQGNRKCEMENRRQNHYL